MQCDSVLAVQWQSEDFIVLSTDSHNHGSGLLRWHTLEMPNRPHLEWIG